jgi:hypothetical protein
VDNCPGSGGTLGGVHRGPRAAGRLHGADGQYSTHGINVAVLKNLPYDPSGFRACLHAWYKAACGRARGMSKQSQLPASPGKSGQRIEGPRRAKLFTARSLALTLPTSAMKHGLRRTAPGM